MFESCKGDMLSLAFLTTFIAVGNCCRYPLLDTLNFGIDPATAYIRKYARSLCKYIIFI